MTNITVKLVEITAQKPLSAQNANGQQFIAGRGEARIYANRADNKGVDITREVKPCEILENLYVSKRGVMVALDEGSKKVDAPDYLSFIPVQKGLNEGERAYDSELHLASIQQAMKNLLAMKHEGESIKPGMVTLRMTNPGTYEGREVSEARKDMLEQHLKNLGVKVEWVLATADLPQDERMGPQAKPVDYGAFVAQPGDLLVSGSRRLRSQRVTEALHKVGGLLLQAQKPQRLIVPMTIGANLAFAEAAQQAGLPVVLAFIGSRPESWMDGNRERLNALTQAGAQIIGDLNHQYEQGVFSASIEKLAGLVKDAGAKVALVAAPDSRDEGRSLQGQAGVLDFYAPVIGYLRKTVGEDAIEKELADKPGPTAQPAQPQLEEVPF